MAFNHGSKATLWIGDSGGTLRDLSAYLKKGGMSRGMDSAETSALGTTAKTYIPGLTEASISLEGMFDPTVDGYLAGILNPSLTARSFEYYPAGPGTGNIRYSGSGYLTKYDAEADVGDAAMISGEFQVSGAVTRTVL